MKLNKIFAAFMLIAAVAFTACEPQVPPTPTPGPGPGGNDTTITEEPTDDPTNGNTQAPDTAGWNIPAGALTVAQAREICAALEAGATTGTKYYVMGYVKKIHDKHASGISGYGNAQFYMEDVKGANSRDDFMAYQVYGLDGKKMNNPDAVAVGDFVVIYGELTNYMGNTYETVGKGAAYIWKSTNPLLAESSTGEAGGGSTDSGNGGSTGGGTGTNPDAPDVPNIDIPAGAIVFDADSDKGNAGTDSNNAAAYTITKDGVTMTVSQGIIGGPYNNEMHYRIYKNQTLTVTSTAGNVKEIILTCTANGDAKYGPGNFIASTGDYEFGTNAVGTWTGSANEVVFTASSNQVRATQIIVVVE